MSLMKIDRGGGGLCAVVAFVAACSGDPGASGDETTGTAVARITSVPGGVQCIRLAARGAGHNFGVMASASSASLDLGALPSGTALVSGQAFDVACPAGDAAPVATPTWVSDPVSVTINAGLTTSLSLVLRPNTHTAASVDFALPAVSIALGGDSSYAVMQDGFMRVWGENNAGQLGDHTTTTRRLPVRTGSADVVVVQLAVGNQHACLLSSTNRVSCWGAGAQGQLGDGRGVDSTSDATVPGTYSAIAAGGDSTCALSDAATPRVYCWGYNGDGQLADGTTTNRLAPSGTLPSGSFIPVGIAVGGHTACHRWTEGVAVCWGDNSHGTFGVSPPTNNAAGAYSGHRHTSSIVVSGLGGHSCGLTPDGRVRCTGQNDLGQLGDGSQIDRSAPTLVADLYDVTQVVVGMTFSCALRRDGTVWCWGHNVYGALGDGSWDGFSPSPVQVLGLTGVASIGAGNNHACARRTDGTVWCWGANGSGQLGDGTIETRFVPVRAQL